MRENALSLLRDGDGDGEWIEPEEITDASSPDLRAARDVLTLLSRLEAAERERDDARINAIQQAHDASAAMWREQKNRADAAEERERELTRALSEWRELGNVSGGGYSGDLKARTDALLAGGVSALNTSEGDGNREHLSSAKAAAIPGTESGERLLGICDEYGTIWSGEPGASERIGDLVQRGDEETYEVRLAGGVSAAGRLPGDDDGRLVEPDGSPDPREAP